MKTPISQQSQSARVGRDVPPDLTRALRTQIEGENVALLAQIVIRGLENNPGVSDEDTGNRIERANFVEVGERED